MFGHKSDRPSQSMRPGEYCRTVRRRHRGRSGAPNSVGPRPYAAPGIHLDTRGRTLPGLARNSTREAAIGSDHDQAVVAGGSRGELGARDGSTATGDLVEQMQQAPAPTETGQRHRIGRPLQEGALRSSRARGRRGHLRGFLELSQVALRAAPRVGWRPANHTATPQLPA
jgi:hypothetical protein